MRTLSPLLAGGRATVAGRFKPATFFDRIDRAATILLRRTNDLHDALRSARQREAGHVLGAVRDMRCGTCQRRTAGGVRVPIFNTADRRVRTVGRLLCEHGQSADRQAQSGNGGLPLPGQTIRLVDSAGDPVPDGEAGEVVIKGPNVMRGYLNRPEETAKTIVDGWLHTGDMGRFDEDGYLMLVDRAKDMIIRGGENIYPREIEAVVHQLPQIAEAAVVGRRTRCTARNRCCSCLCSRTRRSAST